ncbi:histone-like nucleoid-structuring protein Lsr2 [Streptomyces sp. NPDC002855]|uniref:Lsr2 dimerization domain-containing protein n=1 Tax=Streptomyces sp. NPDC002855 TaxID=3154437 RepID=UPI00332475F1
MAVRAVQIDADEFNAADHDDPNFSRVATHIPGVGSVDTYWRKEYVDDLTGKPTEGTETFKFAVPVLVEDDEEDYYKSQWYEIDLSEASLAKFVKAVTPYVEKARRHEAMPTQTSLRTSSRSSSNPKLTEWNRRAKAWLRDAGHEVKDRGRLPNNLEEVYIKNHPDDPKPE